MEKERKLNKIDFILLSIVTVLYALFSFYHLGSFDNPNTFVSNKEVLFQVHSSKEIRNIRYFTGHEMGTVKVSVSQDGKNYSYLEDIKNPSVFAWHDLDVNQVIQYVRFEIDEKSNIGEIAFYDIDEKMVKLSSSEKKLLDEQNTVPFEIGYFNSTYFDEIYFARSAYEYANGLPVYEWVHPPFGKLIMALPIKIFKMAPFYFRFMGNVAGILMIPILYIFAKRLFRKTKYAFLASVFMSMDGFHYAHTRMATVDSFLVLFILLSFFFFYTYLISKDVSFLKKISSLFFSSFFMGCAIMVKWTGFFASLGLAILFFAHFFKHYFTFGKIEKEGWKILGFCTLFFVIFPICLYCVIYLCFPNMLYFKTRNIKEIIEITMHMFTYHSTLKEPHPFYSPFYTWPFLLHPVWYYVKVVGNVKSTISGFGNPILWWLGFVSILYIVYKSLKKEKEAIFLLLIYGCLFFPYFRITRGMFLYHYFPALPFVFLALVYLMRDITEKYKNNYFYITILVLVCFFFFYFFPVISGVESTVGHIKQLQWISSWHF